MHQLFHVCHGFVPSPITPVLVREPWKLLLAECQGPAVPGEGTYPWEEGNCLGALHALQPGQQKSWNGAQTHCCAIGSLVCATLQLCLLEVAF